MKFFCGYGRNEGQAEQIINGFEKYYYWAEKAGYEVDFRISNNGTYDKDLKEILAAPQEAIKEAFMPKQESPSMKMKL